MIPGARPQTPSDSANVHVSTLYKSHQRGSPAPDVEHPRELTIGCLYALYCALKLGWHCITLEREDGGCFRGVCCGISSRFAQAITTVTRFVSRSAGFRQGIDCSTPLSHPYNWSCIVDLFTLATEIQCNFQHTVRFVFSNERPSQEGILVAPLENTFHSLRTLRQSRFRSR